MGFDEDGDDFSNFYNAELSSSLNIPVWKAIYRNSENRLLIPSER